VSAVGRSSEAARITASGRPRDRSAAGAALLAIVAALLSAPPPAVATIHMLLIGGCARLPHEELADATAATRYYFNHARYSRAIESANRALSIEKVHGREHPEILPFLHALGVLYTEMGRYDQAREVLEQSLAIREKLFIQDNPGVADALEALSFLDFQMGDFAGARALAERAQSILEEPYGPEHPKSPTGCIISLRSTPPKGRRRRPRPSTNGGHRSWRRLSDRSIPSSPAR
jgi:tetratricopeptide (TPR) repeat protein